MLLRALLGRFGEILSDVFRVTVAPFRARAGEDPGQIGVRQVQCITTLAADPTRRSIGTTDQRLAEPKRESLLSNSRRSVKEETLRQRPRDDSWKQSFSQLVMTVQRNYRHLDKLARVAGVVGREQDHKRKTAKDAKLAKESFDGAFASLASLAVNLHVTFT